jgi:signal transduction histidine kinase
MTPARIWAIARRWLVGIAAVPERFPERPALTPRLAAFLAGLWILALAALIPAVLRPHPIDWAGALLAGALVALMSAWSVPAAARVQGRWSASAYLELAFAFSVGPVAIAAMSVGHAMGDHVRRRPGSVRTAFNAANHILRNLAAWAAFSAIGGTRPSIALALAAGVVGGVVSLAVGTGLLGLVLGIATHDFQPRELRRALSRLVHWDIAFGFAAGGVSVLYRIGGPVGLFVLLVPVIMLQLSLVATARRMHAEAEKDAAHAREREQLLRSEAQALRRAGDASEMERKRIAADLHDSVIQDVSGLLFRSSAMLGRLSDGDPSISSREGVETFLTYTRDLAAEAVRELRTLMVELAPPLLDEEGLSSALRQLLSRLDRDHISWVLDCTEEQLDQRQQRLVYRVIQEALRNVVKHAQCHTVWVAVVAEDDRLLVSIRDDGRGFSAAERAEQRKKGHAGLGLLAQTARDGGGELSITSARGKGTRVEMSTPILPPPAPEETTDVDGATVTPAPASRRDAGGRAVGAGPVEDGLETPIPDARGPRPGKPGSPRAPAASGH